MVVTWSLLAVRFGRLSSTFFLVRSSWDQKGRVGYRPKSKSQKDTECLIPKMYIFDHFLYFGRYSKKASWPKKSWTRPFWVTLMVTWPETGQLQIRGCLYIIVVPDLFLIWVAVSKNQGLGSQTKKWDFITSSFRS